MKIIIFDFDGTVADTFLLAVDIFYRLKPRPVVLPRKEVDRLRGMALLEVVRELNIPVWELPLLMIRGQKLMSQQMANVKLIPGIAEALHALHADEHKLFMVSSNSKENINVLLAKYKLEDCFSGIYGNVRLHGKARAIRKIMHDTGGLADDVYYVGDEVRDVRAARKAGVKSVAVSWGYNNIHVLKQQQPTALIFDPGEIRMVLEHE